VRAFVTGASGFVGGWLRRHLEEMGDVVETLADGIDLTDPGAVSGPLTAAEPDVVYHLAALTARLSPPAAGDPRQLGRGLRRG
jgi:dTDP-4-dehydrorhamnose reductase